MKQFENAKAFFEGLGFDGDAGADERRGAEARDARSADDQQ